ncbi:transposase [Peribacillus frigoritolerans]
MRSNRLLVYTDVGNQFPTAAHLCSWAALVPGHNESAGKRKSSRS